MVSFDRTEGGNSAGASLSPQSARIRRASSACMCNLYRFWDQYVLLMNSHPELDVLVNDHIFESRKRENLQLSENHFATVGYDANQWVAEIAK